MESIRRNQEEEAKPGRTAALEVQAEDLAARLIHACKAHGLTVCSCESFTSGLFGALLGGISGASAVYKGGLITYFTEMKIREAHVDQELIKKYGVVSAECAKAMAENTRTLCESDLGFSFTGNAGPSAMEGKPAGLVYCALAHSKGTEVFEWQISEERNALRMEACRRMLEIGCRAIEDGKIV